jgi:hypothetical protein
MASAAAMAASSPRRVGDGDIADMTSSSVCPSGREYTDRLSPEANLLHDGVGDTFVLVSKEQYISGGGIACRDMQHEAADAQLRSHVRPYRCVTVVCEYFDLLIRSAG